MEGHSKDLEGALLWVKQTREELTKLFFAKMSSLPPLEEKLRYLLSDYLSGVANVVGASVSWSFESHRYFGTEGLTVEKQRKVVLLPKRS